MTSLAVPADPAAPLLSPRAADAPSAVSADLMSGAPRLLILSNLCLASLVAAFVLWAAFARLEEVTVGHGRVIPAAKIQLVQSLEGGIVKSMHVREGQIVEKGELLLQIDPTAFGSTLSETAEKVAGLRHEKARLMAEAGNGDLEARAVEGEPRADLLAQQQSALEASRLELQSRLSTIEQRIGQRRQEVIETEARARSLERSLELARSELALTRPLVAEGAAAKVELIRLESRVAELEGDLEAAKLAVPRLEGAIAEAESELTQSKTAYRADALKRLSEVEVQLATLLQSLKGDADRVARTDMRSPVKGIVQRLHVTTERQVVKPGESIVEIVPLDGTLLVEAQIATRDIAFVRPGQDAVVKITAYDYGIYGSLKGKVERISADAILNDKGDSYYLIEVRTDRASLEKDGRSLPIIPGMVADVDLLTGERTVAQYLMKPLTRLRSESLRER